MTQNYEKLPQDAFTRIPRDTQEAEKISKPSVSFWQDAWRSLKKNKGAIISLILFGLILIMSLVGPMISPYEPNDQTITHANLPPKVPVIENLGIMDATAFALCRDQKLPIKVFSIFKNGALKRVVMGEDEGTLVHV